MLDCPYSVKKNNRPRVSTLPLPHSNNPYPFYIGVYILVNTIFHLCIDKVWHTIYHMSISVCVRVCIPWGLQQASSWAGPGFSFALLWGSRAAALRWTRPDPTSRAPHPADGWGLRVCGACDPAHSHPHTPPKHKNAHSHSLSLLFPVLFLFSHWRP